MSAKEFLKKVAKSQLVLNIYGLIVIFVFLFVLPIFSLSVRAYCAILLAIMIPMIPAIFPIVRDLVLQLQKARKK